MVGLLVDLDFTSEGLEIHILHQNEGINKSNIYYFKNTYALEFCSESVLNYYTHDNV